MLRQEAEGLTGAAAAAALQAGAERVRKELQANLQVRSVWSIFDSYVELPGG